jgi:prevent-host-death family protein
MTATFNVHEAKTQLSKLLLRVEQGEEIVIARAGRPVARLVPERPQPPRRRPEPGSAKGQFVIHEAFYDDLPDDLLDLFEGKDPDDPLNNSYQERQEPEE